MTWREFTCACQGACYGIAVVVGLAKEQWSLLFWCLSFTCAGRALKGIERALVARLREPE